MAFTQIAKFSLIIFHFLNTRILRSMLSLWCALSCRTLLCVFFTLHRFFYPSTSTVRWKYVYTRYVSSLALLPLFFFHHSLCYRFFFSLQVITCTFQLNLREVLPSTAFWTSRSREFFPYAQLGVSNACSKFVCIV